MRMPAAVVVVVATVNPPPDGGVAMAAARRCTWMLRTANFSDASVTSTLIKTLPVAGKATTARSLSTGPTLPMDIA